MFLSIELREVYDEHGAETKELRLITYLFRDKNRLTNQPRQRASKNGHGIFISPYFEKFVSQLINIINFNDQKF